MNDRLSQILEEIRALEKSVEEEIRIKEKEFQYRIHKGKVIFEEEMAGIQKKLSTSVFIYLFKARPLNVLSAPFIYAMIIPAVLMDVFITLYQLICFPIYGIPRVRRKDHIIFDRHYLKYLNMIEKFNCDYCSYFNGLASYASEIGALTEQYWCPVKHASGKARPHSRYHLFSDYGDGEAYKMRLDELRKSFEDLK